MDHEHFGMNQAEMNTIDCLIEGKIISNLAFPRVDERVKRIFTYLSKLTLFVAKVVFQYYHFSKQFLPNLSEIKYLAFFITFCFVVSLAKMVTLATLFTKNPPSIGNIFVSK